jgi:hypothetical protein
MLAVLWLPTLLLAVIQSYRLFRSQLQDKAFFLVRNLSPLVLVLFLTSFSLQAFNTFGSGAWRQHYRVEEETLRAIDKTLAGATKPDATHPLQLTVEDLAKVSPLSERTRRWLRGSCITVVPMKSLPHRAYSPLRLFDLNDAHSWYLVTIHLPGGSDCMQSFHTWDHASPMLVVVCQ